jgi:hypothetical protein
MMRRDRAVDEALRQAARDAIERARELTVGTAELIDEARHMRAQAEALKRGRDARRDDEEGMAP